MSLLCCVCGSRQDKYLPNEETAQTPDCAFTHIPDPVLSDLVAYLRSRAEHLHIYSSTADVRAEVTRSIMENVQIIDQYPKGRQFLGEEEYMQVLKDLLNLSNILDDMEQTNVIPYTTRIQYYSSYARLYRMLIAKARQ